MSDQEFEEQPCLNRYTGPPLLISILFVIINFAVLKKTTVTLSYYKFNSLPACECDRTITGSYAELIAPVTFEKHTGDTFCVDACSSIEKCAFATQTYTNLTDGTSTCQLYSQCSRTRCVEDVYELSAGDPRHYSYERILLGTTSYDVINEPDPQTLPPVSIPPTPAPVITASPTSSPTACQPKYKYGPCVDSNSNFGCSGVTGYVEKVPRETTTDGCPRGDRGSYEHSVLCVKPC